MSSRIETRSAVACGVMSGKPRLMATVSITQSCAVEVSGNAKVGAHKTTGRNDKLDPQRCVEFVG